MINFMGAEGFFWWTGVVEGRDDPLKAGRLQVRIFGIHDDLLSDPVYADGAGMPVDSLPWASVIMPINGAGMNGVGSSPTGAVEGSWVMGFSRDGRACQDLVVMGVIPAIPDTAPNINSGFYDNKQTTPLANRPKRKNDASEHYPKTSYLNEPDVNRLARNDKVASTIVQNKKDTLDKSIPTASGGTWNEPPTPYAAKYPYNHVEESESGHVIERDDTPNAERTHDYHRSGTFKEVHPDGTKVEKVVKDNYEIIMGNDSVHITGVCNVTVDGDATLFVKGNLTQTTDGNANIHVKGNLTQTTDGNANIHVGGDVSQSVSGNYSGNVGGTCNITSGGNMKFSAPRIDLN